MSKQNSKDQPKKRYVKPEAKKHKAAAIVSGSGSGCSTYKSTVSGTTYYY